MASRDQILNQLRDRLRVNRGDSRRVVSVENRLKQHRVNTVPQSARLTHPQLVDRFESHISLCKATVKRIPSLSMVPPEIFRFLGSSSVEICINGDVEALQLPFDQVSGLNLISWSPKTSMGVSVTCCFGAVAETGSVVICSSAQNAVSQNYLGEKHIVLLKASDIVGVYEEVWYRLRQQGRFPRDITFISGPSCTGDIEMIMEYGAHGPRQLHVIVIGESPLDYTPLV